MTVNNGGRVILRKSLGTLRYHLADTVALFTGALSVAAAVFVILEMSHPYSRSMQVSSVPLRDALNQMKK